MNQFQKILFLIPFVSVSLWVTEAYAQNSKKVNVDSLDVILRKESVDSVTIKGLNDYISALLNDDPAVAILYGEKIKARAESVKYLSGIGYALKNIGMGYYHLGEYLKVFEYWHESLKTFEEAKDSVGMANIESNLGVVYFNQGDNAKAIDYYLRSLRMAESLGEKRRLATVLVNIGSVYASQVNTYENALSYYWRALPMGTELQDNEIIGTCTDNMGDIYLKLGKLDSAQYYLEQSLIANANTTYLPFSLTLLGEVFEREEKYDEAIKYQTQSFELAKQQESKLEMLQALIGLGNAQRKKGDVDIAYDTYKYAETLAKEIGARNFLKDAYNGLANTNNRLGKYKEAFQYKALYADLKDTIFNVDTDDKIKRLQFTYEIDKKQVEIDKMTTMNKLKDLEIQQQKYVNYAAVFAGIVLFVLAGGLFNRYRFIRRTNRIIEQEKDRSDKLLLNILPADTAEELKENGSAQARSYSNVTILFTDFKGFTELSATLSPPALVKEIHFCYMAFDEIMVRHGVEKIKTIGDAYMAAGGLPKPNNSHPVDVTLAAIEIREFMDKLIKQRKQVGKPYFEIRIGIHTGPVVAGVVGIHKFAYDIWGDAVNIASRMESNSQPGKINISSATYELIKDQFQCTPRGKISVKGAGEKIMYFVEHELVQVNSLA